MKKFFSILLLIALSICMVSCTKSHSHASGKKPRILVSISPYNSILKELVGDYATIETVVPSGYNSHAYEPNPSDARKWGKAVVFFGIGERFEQKILQSIEKSNPGIIYVNLTESMTDLIYETGHDHHHHNDDEGHFSYDIHVWMDPLMIIEQAKTITATLGDLFPDHVSLWNDHLSSLTHRLLHLDQDINRILAPYKNQSILISHASLGYFCRRYQILQISLEVEGKDPRPQDVKNILAECAAHPPRCGFIQPDQNNKGVTLVAEKLNLPLHDIYLYAPDYEDNLLKIAHYIAGDS